MTECHVDYHEIDRTWLKEELIHGFRIDVELFDTLCDLVDRLIEEEGILRQSISGRVGSLFLHNVLYPKVQAYFPAVFPPDGSNEVYEKWCRAALKYLVTRRKGYLNRRLQNKSGQTSATSPDRRARPRSPSTDDHFARVVVTATRAHTKEAATTFSADFVPVPVSHPISADMTSWDKFIDWLRCELDFDPLTETVVCPAGDGQIYVQNERSLRTVLAALSMKENRFIFLNIECRNPSVEVAPSQFRPASSLSRSRNQAVTASSSISPPRGRKRLASLDRHDISSPHVHIRKRARCA